MTYYKKFVVAIKHGGKILREADGCVTLPFGSEYSILLKNLESRKAEVAISIDGRDVLGGGSLIIEANDSIALERFLDEDMNHGYRFKFIQKSKEIVEHRGDKLDDGIVRVEYRFEAKKKQVITEHHHHHHHDFHDWWHYIPRRRRTDTDDVSHWETSTYSTSVGDSELYSSMSNTSSEIKASIPKSDEGITVEGSDSHQEFYQGHINELESSSYTIVLRLRGTFDKEPVTKPITVRTKLKCDYCGRTSKSGAKYCPTCGARLTIK